MTRVEAIGAAVLVTGLLGAFDRVVRQSVAQGMAARVTTARLAQALSICNREPQRDLRLQCRADAFAGGPTPGPASAYRGRPLAAVRAPAGL